ncbi:MAG: colicin D domain-containing protein [Bacteroidota bacterium]
MIRMIHLVIMLLDDKSRRVGDFGVTGNFNKANAAKFNSAINQHINSPGVRAIQGTYRGNPVTHYVNPNTGLNVISNPNGTFLSGWKLNPAQLQNVLQHGGL